MHVFVEALREGNDIMRERHNFELPPILGEETWNLIKDCACEVNELPNIYCSLMKDVDNLRIILQHPTEARKAVIMQIIFLLIMCWIEDLKLSGCYFVSKYLVCHLIYRLFLLHGTNLKVL